MWRTDLKVSVPDKALQNEGIFIAVIDFNTKKYLAKCIVPVFDMDHGVQ